jgi:cyclic pyranopterin phosphate synthase
MSFNHFDAEGRAHMVDISGKEPTLREALAEAVVDLGPALLERMLDGRLVKGDVLGVARLAGITAVKKTPDLIPLAHTLGVHHAAVEFTPDRRSGRLGVRCRVRSRGRTGVEMEAMTGATVAALAVYDMVKGENRNVAIARVRLLHKSGGRSGTWNRDPESA